MKHVFVVSRAVDASLRIKMTPASSRSPSPTTDRVRRNLLSFLRYYVNPFKRGDYLEPFQINLGVKDRWRVIFLCFYHYGLLPKGPLCDGKLYLCTLDETVFELEVPAVYASYSHREQEAIDDVIEKVLRYDQRYDTWGFSEHWRDFPSAVDPPSEGGFHSLVYHALSISINM